MIHMNKYYYTSYALMLFTDLVRILYLSRTHTSLS